MTFVVPKSNTHSDQVNKQGVLPSLQDYQMIVENMTECVWIFDLKNHHFRYFNPAIESLLGYHAEEAMSLKLEDLLTPESLQKIKRSSLKRLPPFIMGKRSEEVVYEVDEYEQYCKDGSTKIVETSTRLVYNQDTQGVDVIGVSRDITARKQYERTLVQKLRDKTQLIESFTSLPEENSFFPRIYFFKKFLVYGATHQEPITWRTKKAKELFAFLLFNDPTKISKCKIIESLWPDSGMEKASTYLYTTFYHMKKDLAAAGIDIQIKCSQGYYTYHLPTYYSDWNEVKQILDQTASILSCTDDTAAADFERVILLYKGDFLYENDFLWAEGESNLIRKQFEKAAFSLSRYYFLRRDYEATKRVLKKLLEKDNLNEVVHELLLKVYLQEKDPTSFINHYNRLKNTLSEELGTVPRSSIQQLLATFQREHYQ